MDDEDYDPSVGAGPSGEGEDRHRRLAAECSERPRRCVARLRSVCRLAGAFPSPPPVATIAEIEEVGVVAAAFSGPSVPPDRTDRRKNQRAISDVSNFRDVLLVLNGAPAVGKSTLARRYADNHPLSLVVDIDTLRTLLGGWAEIEESRLVARDLAIALVRAHLSGGHDVLVPQYLGRPEFLERLRGVALEVDAPFVELVLTDDVDEITARFRRRRAEFTAAAATHPESDLDDDAIATEVPEADERLLRDAASRGVPVISVAGGPDAAYQRLCLALADRS